MYFLVVYIDVGCCNNKPNVHIFPVSLQTVKLNSWTWTFLLGDATWHKECYTCALAPKTIAFKNLPNVICWIPPAIWLNNRIFLLDPRILFKKSGAVLALVLVYILWGGGGTDIEWSISDGYIVTSALLYLWVGSIDNYFLSKLNLVNYPDLICSWHLDNLNSWTIILIIFNYSW